MITVTSLVHPTMIVKIRLGLRYAALGQGDKMNGHGNRVYIANRKGHNILRLDYKGEGKFVAYGGCQFGSTDVTEIVKEAIQRGCSAMRVKPRQLDKPSPEAIALVNSSPSLKHRLLKLAGLAGISLAVVLSTPASMAQWEPQQNVLNRACNATPQMLICNS